MLLQGLVPALKWRLAAFSRYGTHRRAPWAVSWCLPRHTIKQEKRSIYLGVQLWLGILEVLGLHSVCILFCGFCTVLKIWTQERGAYGPLGSAVRKQLGKLHTLIDDAWGCAFSVDYQNVSVSSS